jgi:hypothetical protein
MGQEQHPAEQEQQTTQSLKPRRILTWTRGIAALTVILGLGAIGVIIYGYVSTAEWVGVSEKRFWDYLDLLIVPAALVIGAAWLTRQQRESELEVEDQRAQDESLQAYLNQMSELLIDKDLRSKTHWLDDARVTARARSLATLRRLDGGRKRTLLQFLYEAQLINKNNRQLDEAEREKLGPDGPTEFEARIVGLSGADLRYANLRHLNLAEAALDGAILEKADLRDSKLSNSDLGGTYLSEANLSNAELKGASLVNAGLSGANLSGAQGVTPKQLDQAASLERTTMPNGQKYEEWLKDKTVITCTP